MPFHCRDYQQVSTTIQLARKGQNFTQKGHQTMKLFYKCTGIKKKNGIDITELGQFKIQSCLIGSHENGLSNYFICYVTGTWLFWKVQTRMTCQCIQIHFCFRKERIYMSETLKSAKDFKVGNGHCYAVWHNCLSQVQNEKIWKSIKFTQRLDHCQKRSWRMWFAQTGWWERHRENLSKANSSTSQ